MASNNIRAWLALEIADTTATLSESRDYATVAVDGLNHVSTATTTAFAPGSGGSDPGNSGEISNNGNQGGKEK